MENITTSNRKVLAIHQPNYIPWLGYFHKMAHSHIFVYLDSVQYPRGQSYSSRNRIKTANGTPFLTIPVKIPRGKSGKTTYLEIEIDGNKWKRKHLRTVELNYKKAPYFQEVFALYQEQLEKHQQFCELNIGLIEAIACYLELSTQRTRLSNELDEFGQKSHLIVDLCQILKATTYLSGTGGGKEYNDEQILNAADIELAYSSFEHPIYPQSWGDFVSNLSILDTLFNCGKDTRKFLL